MRRDHCVAARRGELDDAEMAGVVGPFEAYEQNKEPMQRVMRMHRDAVEDIDDSGPEYLKDAARQLWDKVIELGNRYAIATRKRLCWLRPVRSAL